MSHETLVVALGDRSYPIHIGGAIAGEASLYAPHVQGRRAALVTSQAVAALHADRVEEALKAASDDADLGPFERLLDALQRPYDESPERAYYAEPAPAAVTACYRTFCGT